MGLLDYVRDATARPRKMFSLLADGDFKGFAQQGMQNVYDGMSEISDGLTSPDSATRMNTGIGFFGPTVYHGTPHVVDKFRMDKIGTGEGAQAYGHGLYFAEEPAVAREYQQTLTKRVKDRLSYDGQAVDPNGMLGRAMEDVALIGRDAAVQKIDDNIKFNSKYAPDMASLYESVRDKVAALDPSKVSLNRGNLYKVDVPDPPELLHWDKPLSEQPEKVRQGLLVLDPDSYKPGSPDYDPMEPGQMIYQRLMGQARDYAITAGKDSATTLPSAQAKASMDLRDVGIPGLLYQDGFSRGPSKIYNVGSPDPAFGPATPFNTLEEAQANLEMVRRYHPNAQISVQKQPQTHNYVIWDEDRISSPINITGLLR